MMPLGSNINWLSIFQKRHSVFLKWFSRWLFSHTKKMESRRWLWCGRLRKGWEQVLAVGAAVQNIMVAAHALGIGAMWRTGDLANDETVKARLGFADKDQVVGFVYLGTPAGALKNLPDEQPETFLRELPRGRDE